LPRTYTFPAAILHHRFRAPSPVLARSYTGLPWIYTRFPPDFTGFPWNYTGGAAGNPGL